MSKALNLDNLPGVTMIHINADACEHRFDSTYNGPLSRDLWEKNFYG